jgi:Peptidase family C25
MVIRKLIVTNLKSLKKKYGVAGVTLIKKAVTRLVAADALRGITTSLEDVDHPGKGAPRVTVSGNAKQVKTTIDALYAAYASPDYVLILGGPDIIPFQILANPMRIPGGDTDPNVPSDLPYACAAPYATDIAKFIGATRVVGRLPDVRGGKDAEQLVSVIDASTIFSGTPNKDSFALAADQWSGASLENIKLAFGAAPRRPLTMVPPHAPPWTTATLAAPLHFINCHGGDTDPNYYGSEPAYPDAHVPTNLLGNVTRGSVVAAECCYGAQLYKPTAATPLGIANTYLLQGAIGYCGSTNIAYGGEKKSERCAADVFCVEFVKSVLASASIGRALLEARQKYVASLSGPVDPSDLKTLGQFLLLGDPSARPFGVGLETHAVTGLHAHLVEAAFNRVLRGTRGGKALTAAVHRSRRLKLTEAGREISRSKAFASRKAKSSDGAGHAKAAELLERDGARPGPTLTFIVETPSAAGPRSKAKGAKSAKTMASAREEIHVTFASEESHAVADGGSYTQVAVLERTRAKVVNIKAVVTRTRDGEVVSSKPITSR